MQVIDDENGAYIQLLCGHLRRLTRRLRAIPPGKWEWQPNPFTPSPCLVAQHVWLWLVCDRRHINEPDASTHPTALAPAAQADLCALLERETEEWRALLDTMTPGQLAQARFAFNWRAVNVRWVVWHMCQNVIYKHGQLAALYFQLGLDGEEPYEAPLPQKDYERLAEMMRHPAIEWVLEGHAADALPAAVRREIDTTDSAGCTPLHYAVWRGDARKVRLLLEHGADVNSAYAEGWTPLMDAAWLGSLEIVRVLLVHGADIAARTTRGYMAADLASEAGHSAVFEALTQWRCEE